MSKATIIVPYLSHMVTLGPFESVFNLYRDLKSKNSKKKILLRLSP